MDIKTAAERVQRFVLRELWGRELAGLPRARKIAFQSMRTLSLAVHGFLVDRCSLRAAALTLRVLCGQGVWGTGADQARALLPPWASRRGRQPKT